MVVANMKSFNVTITYLVRQTIQVNALNQDSAEEHSIEVLEKQFEDSQEEQLVNIDSIDSIEEITLSND